MYHTFTSVKSTFNVIWFSVWAQYTNGVNVSDILKQ